MKESSALLTSKYDLFRQAIRCLVAIFRPANIPRVDAFFASPRMSYQFRRACDLDWIQCKSFKLIIKSGNIYLVIDYED